jgi:hypothetical protein
MAKAKYDWDAISRDYQSDMQSKDILKKYNLTRRHLSVKMSLLKIKKQKDKYIKLFNAGEVEKIRNKFYFGVWFKKTQIEIARILKVKATTLNQILNYKRFTNYLNLTPEQITTLHQEMKQKRNELQKNDVYELSRNT